MNPSPWANEFTALAPRQAMPAPPRELPGEPEAIDQVSATPPETVAALGGLERTSNGAKLGIAGLAPDVVAGKLPGAPHVAEDLDEVKQRLALVRQLASDPKAKLDWITSRTDDLTEHAPATALQASQTLSRGIDYLASIAPAPPRQSPFETEPRDPSRLKLLQWASAAHVIDDPIKAIEEGGISSQGLKALQTVYPALHNELRSAVMDELATNGPPSSLKGQTQTSRLLGLTNPQTLLANQEVIAAQSKKPPSPQDTPKPARPKPAAPASTAASLQTTSERLAAHNLGSKY